MGSSKLVLTVLMSFSLLTLSACKQSNSGKTPVRKAGAQKPGDGTARTQTDPTKPGTAGTNGKPNKTGTSTAGSEDVVVTEPEGAVVGGGKGKASCSSVEEKAKANGWKINSIEVPESSGSSKKLKIVYFTLEKSDFSNPVLYFNRNAFQSTDPSELERLAKVASDFKIDFVLMDMRGSGCSSALPDLKTKSAELSNYGSKNIVADAEEIRKKIIKEKQWKIMAHRSGGIVALRYVQLFPAGVKAIHIADFYPAENQTKLMQSRLEKESELWKTIAEQQKISEATVEKALKNLQAEKCTGLSSCKVLVDLFGGIKISQKEQWPQIAKVITDLADGKLKAAGLMEQYQVRKKGSELASIARILDVDSDISLSACATALKTENKSVINSCRLEVEMRKGENVSLKNLTHTELKMSVIKENLSRNEIEYHLFEGGKSALYPHEGYKEHEEEMGDALKTTSEVIDEAGSEVYLNETFLKGLR